MNDKKEPEGYEVPGWIKDTLQEARILLGVGDEWHINVSMYDRADGDDAAAYCDPDSKYLNASISIANGAIGNNDVGREQLFHEVAHILHAEIDDFVEAILDGLHRDAREQATRLYEQHLERFVQKLSRAICRNVKETK